MARLCKEMIATAPWMERIDEEEFPLGSVTAFYASGNIKIFIYTRTYTTKMLTLSSQLYTKNSLIIIVFYDIFRITL